MSIARKSHLDFKGIAITIFLAAHPVLASSISVDKIKLGHSYVCHFGKYGKAIIDTREPGASITIGGVRYAASSGSYFYQTDDGKLAIAFNPEMTVRTYVSAEDPIGITASHCGVTTNKRQK